VCYNSASLAALFSEFDKNGDGNLGPDEVAAMMRQIGHGSNAEVKKLLANMDDDRSGFISPDEFAASIAAGRATESMNEVCQLCFILYSQSSDLMCSLLNRLKQHLISLILIVMVW
jgi:Ca2+-binding EF-hand superfamily protein